LKGHDCVKGDGAVQPSKPKGCAGGKFSLTMKKVKAILPVPAGTTGQTVGVKCNFGDMNQGKVNFKCGSDGSWSMAADNCHQAGECPVTAHKRKMNGVTATFKLGRAKETNIIKRKCAFGSATVGDAWFKCSEGKWTDLRSTCLKPGQCKHMSVGHNLGWSEIYVGDKGEVQERKCNFGALTGGIMKFTCKDSTWASDTSDCKLDIPEGMSCPDRELVFDKRTMGTWMSVYEQDELMKFHMEPAAEGVHTTACGDGFNGWASFQCHKNGTWSLLRSRQATTCWAGSASRLDWNKEYLACKKKYGSSRDC